MSTRRAFSVFLVTGALVVVWFSFAVIRPLIHSQTVGNPYASARDYLTFPMDVLIVVGALVAGAWRLWRRS